VFDFHDCAKKWKPDVDFLQSPRIINEQVMDYLGIDELLERHILKRWTMDARDVLLDHLQVYQNDDTPTRSFTYYRHCTRKHSSWSGWATPVLKRMRSLTVCLTMILLQESTRAGGLSKRTRFCTICRCSGHKRTSCPQCGDAPKQPRKPVKWRNWGHRRNTCMKQGGDDGACNCYEFSCFYHVWIEIRFVRLDHAEQELSAICMLCWRLLLSKQNLLSCL
jgi:hypothetical protein